VRASPPVSTREQLDWETRWARPAAIAAAVGGTLSMTAVAVRLAAIGGESDDDRDLLRTFQDNSDAFALSVGLQAIAFVLIAGALYYLLRAAMARRPEVPRWILGFLALAPALLVVGGILDQLSLRDVADTFTSSGRETVGRAEDLLEDRAFLGSALAATGTLCLAVAFVFASINAMRAGLLSRFMGVLGALVGALLVLPLLPGGQVVIQLFWLTALGMLFLGRWPGGRGPAWETGEAVEWPTAAARREQS
jgi:hypothetical protein